MSANLPNPSPLRLPLPDYHFSLIKILFISAYLEEEYKKKGIKKAERGLNSN